MSSLNYAWETVEGGLRVRDVEIMSYVTPEDRPDFGLEAPIDSDWFKSAIQTFEDRKKKGKAGAYVFLGHNKWSEESKIIGRIESLAFRDHWLRGDILITEPLAIEAMKRGELPTRSAEFNAKRKLLWGLALIMGHEGHFDEELPDLTLKQELAALAADEKNSSMRLPLPLKLGDAMSQEILAAINTLSQTVDTKFNELAGRVANLEAGANKPKPEADANLAALKAAEAEASKAKWVASLATAKANLAANKCPLTSADIDKQLAEIPAGNDAALAEAVKRLAALPVMPTDSLAQGTSSGAAQGNALSVWNTKHTELVKAGADKRTAYAKLRASEPELFGKMLTEANKKNPAAVRDYLSK